MRSFSGMCEITGVSVVSILTLKAFHMQKRLPEISTSHPLTLLLHNSLLICNYLHVWFLRVCVCVFILLLFSMASQFPWWIWNCWTCLVKAATVMGLIKTRGVERRSCGLAAAAALVACSAVGRDWMSRERERAGGSKREGERIGGGGECSCWEIGNAR